MPRDTQVYLTFDHTKLFALVVHNKSGAIIHELSNVPAGDLPYFATQYAKDGNSVTIKQNPEFLKDQSTGGFPD